MRCDIRRGSERAAYEIQRHLLGTSASPGRLHLRPEFALEDDEALDSLLALGGGRRYILREKRYPRVPAPGATQLEQRFLVLLSALLEPRRYDQQRLPDQCAPEKLHDYEQTTEPPVSIRIRVQRFKLVMSHGGLNDRRNGWGELHPAEKGFDARAQLIVRWRRDESSLMKPAAAGADDDDAITKLPRVRELTCGVANEGQLKPRSASRG